MPSRSSIQRRIQDDFGAYEIYLRKYGQRAADKKFPHWHPRDRATLPLEVLEFDDKDSRCYLWDEETGLPCGRAYVTAGIDQCTLAPLGFSISDQHRNLFSAKEAYLSAILPFDTADAAYCLVKDIPEFYGQFGIAIFDNALYNHAKDLEATLLDVSRQAIVAWAKPHTPREKSSEEDFNARMDAGYFSKLPGYGGPKNTTNLLKDGIAASCLTTQKFRSTFFKWVFDDYCNTPRQGGYTPRQRWINGMKNIVQRVPASVAASRLAIMARGEKRLRGEGLRLAKGLSYQSSNLIVLQRFLGGNAKVQFRYDPNRLSAIAILDPRTHSFFYVPSTTPDYVKGLSLYQHRLMLKLCKERGKNNPELLDLLVAREQLQKMIMQLRVSKNMRDREIGKKMANIHGQKDDILGVEKSSAIIQSVSEMEASMMDIDDIEMEAGEEGWELQELVAD
jgi:putative transposase